MNLLCGKLFSTSYRDLLSMLLLELYYFYKVLLTEIHISFQEFIFRRFLHCSLHCATHLALGKLIANLLVDICSGEYSALF